MAWQKTDLHIIPPVWPMADTDRFPFEIPNGEVAISATAIMIRTDTGASVSGVIESVAMNGASTGAIVTVSGLTRGVEYQLKVPFTHAGGKIATRLLEIPCVA